MTALFHLLLQNTTQVLAVISTLFGIAATIFSLSSFLDRIERKKENKLIILLLGGCESIKKLH